ncbi:hypothetical protein [Candidatus Palauibacter sp.]|uniref:hypothetical protein n=1 Tax=Candidatus Palauibacter sp. TaxID=3101350 RepID=UPI003B599DFF
MLIRRAHWLLIAMLGAADCAPPPDTPPDRPPEDPLWIGILRRDFHLVPIARYDADRPASAEGEGWDEPWPELFRLADLRFDRDRGTPVISPEFATATGADITASGGSVGYDWSRTTEAPVDWYFHVRGQSASTITTAHLSLMWTECRMAWSLPVEETPELEEALRQAALRRDAPVAVTFSRAPDAVVDDAEISALDEIRLELNLVDRPEPGRPPDDNAATFRWLGFYRFGDLLLGVVHERGYEYQMFQVVRIDGDRGRIVAAVQFSGC